MFKFNANNAVDCSKSFLPRWYAIFVPESPANLPSAVVWTHFQNLAYTFSNHTPISLKIIAIFKKYRENITCKTHAILKSFLVVARSRCGAVWVGRGGSAVRTRDWESRGHRFECHWGRLETLAISFVTPTLPASFGRDAESRRSLLSGVYARGSKRCYTGCSVHTAFYNSHLNNRDFEVWRIRWGDHWYSTWSIVSKRRCSRIV